MAEIKLVKKYPNIRDEDVTEIFQEGYLKGFENGRKNAIPIEWIKSKKTEITHEKYDYVRGCQEGFNDCIDMLIMDWEKENEESSNSD